MGGEGVEDLSGDGHWGAVRGEVLLPRRPSDPGEIDRSVIGEGYIFASLHV